MTPLTAGRCPGPGAGSGGRPGGLTMPRASASGSPSAGTADAKAASMPCSLPHDPWQAQFGYVSPAGSSARRNSPLPAPVLRAPLDHRPDAVRARAFQPFESTFTKASDVVLNPRLLTASSGKIRSARSARSGRRSGVAPRADVVEIRKQDVEPGGAEHEVPDRRDRSVGPLVPVGPDLLKLNRAISSGLSRTSAAPAAR